MMNFPRYNNFDKLSVEDATTVLYDQLVPACEANGIFLSSYGNNFGQGPVSVYNTEKAQHGLFNVKQVQKVFTWAQNLQVRASYRRGSYDLKHSAEKAEGYTANGELIAALILCGHCARFRKKGKPMDVNREFKIDESRSTRLKSNRRR